MSAPSSSKSSSKSSTRSLRNRKTSRNKDDPESIDQGAGDEWQRAQTSTNVSPQSVSDSSGDGNRKKRRRVGERDAQSSRDSGDGGGHGTSIAQPTRDHSPMETINEDRSIIVPTESLLVTPEHPSTDHGNVDEQNREAARQGADPELDFEIQKSTPTVAIKPRDENVGGKGASISLFKNPSNFKMKDTNFITVGRDATIIRFGDGQFTEIQRNLICDYIANLTVLPNIDDNLKRHVLTQSIISLPRSEAVFNDYENKKKSGPCFEGTRVELLKEMADWITGPDESRMYVLSGLAGIGKSTVAYTVASKAADLNLLGASFFFSRDEADRKSAKKFFTTIAYQLCVYDESFAKAIGDVLLTERGSAATTKDPQEQLKALILDPLRSIAQSRARPILVVVDALDECDEEDEYAVVTGLSQLIRLLPSFKVILTTRPQPLANYLFENHDDHKTFYLQDIEDKVVDGDIRLYLSHTLSLEQVRARLLNPKEKWCASDKDIASLVSVAGRLFIIASTAVLYVLNKSLGNPGSRMKKLLDEIAQDRTPFHTLNHFYLVIVRSAIQVNDDIDGNDDVVDQYQIIVGTILIIQTPLPVATLTCFIGDEPETIYAMLRNLQSVILLGSDDVPRVYHKSFPDYLTDDTRCKDPRLRIDAKTRHTEIAKQCFKIMDKHLKYNILDLEDPARFMSNEDLKEGGITDEVLQEKIPQELRYACVYWATHFEAANTEDADLMDRLVGFADDHLLHWFEVLSLIEKLDLAHGALYVVRKLLKPSSNFHHLFSDASRFISKFYDIIERSALHTYYSALPFTATGSALCCRYFQEAVHGICDIEGGPEKWDALIAHHSHEEYVKAVKFSLDSALFASFSEGSVDDSPERKLKIRDATTGAPISTIPGHRFAVSNDFSTLVSSEDNVITSYNVNGRARGAMFTTSATIERLALSRESNRVAAALSDGTVQLWDSRNGKLMDSFDGFESNDYFSRLQFSAPGIRLAYSSSDDIFKLRDGLSGRFIANFQCRSRDNFEFSGDGSRIVSLSRARELKLWNSGSGALISAVRDDPDSESNVILAISVDGSLLATADVAKVKLWSEDHNVLTQIKVLELTCPAGMVFAPNDILAITTTLEIRLYNVKTHSFISTIPFIGHPTVMAFSPDCSYLALGMIDGGVFLWDIRDSGTSDSPLVVTALALSRDCSRLACGFGDGTVELWETSSTRQRIASNQVHDEFIRGVAFSPDGRLFTAGSDEGTITLWNGGDGSLRETLKALGGLQAVSLSNSLLVEASESGVTLWSLDTLSLVHTFEASCDEMCKVSIAENSNSLIAVITRNIEDNDGGDDGGDIDINKIAEDDGDSEVGDDGVDNNIDETTNGGDDEDSDISKVAKTGSNDNEGEDGLDSENEDHKSSEIAKDSEGRGASEVDEGIEVGDAGDAQDLDTVSLLDVVNRTTTPIFRFTNRIYMISFLQDNSQLMIQFFDGTFVFLDPITKQVTKGFRLEHLIQLPDTPLWHGVPVWHSEDKEERYFSALFSQHKSPVPVLWIPKGLYVDQCTQGRSIIALCCEDGRVILLRLPMSP